MTTRTQAGRIQTVSLLRHAVFALGGAFLLAAGILCANVFLKNRDASQVELNNQLIEKQIRATSGEVERANRLVASEVPTDLSAVAKLQSKIEKMAAARHCTVVEFRASSELSPYLTRFAKTTTVSGWGQVTAQFSLSGSAKNVTATLMGLLDADIPFEFDALNITREKTDAVGDAIVVGHATMRVLIRTAKVAA